MTLTTRSPQTAAPPPTPHFEAYEDFLAWALQQEHSVEWVQGKVNFNMPTSRVHQSLVLFLGALLTQFVQLLKLGEVFTDSFQIRLTTTGREPDVLFVSNARQANLHDTYLEGPADLVIEVVSDESVNRDREEKFYEYEAAGIPEYWMLDPRPHRRRAYFYQLDARGQYQPVPVGEDGVYRSRVLPELWVNVNWLLGPKFPNPLLALVEVLGAERYAHLLAAAQAEK